MALIKGDLFRRICIYLRLAAATQSQRVCELTLLMILIINWLEIVVCRLIVHPDLDSERDMMACSASQESESGDPE